MPHNVQPFHLPDPQRYAVDQEAHRHDDALYHFGEYTGYILMWHLVDHEQGLVGRCPRCYVAYGETAEAYGQAAKHHCPDCYGTTFEGGYKAIIVRPSLWDFNQEDFRENERGEIIIASANVQTTSDFRLRNDDTLVRADGTRWQARGVSANTLRTGFEYPSNARTAVGFNYGPTGVARLDESAVAYQIPPDGASWRALLDVTLPRLPQDFSAVEEIRGPLL